MMSSSMELNTVRNDPRSDKYIPILGHKTRHVHLKVAKHKIADNKVKEKGDSWIDTVIELVKANIGSGIFAMPFAFATGGIVFTTIMLILTCWVTYYTMVILVKAKNHVRMRHSDRYGELARIIFGVSGKYTVEMFIFVLQFGACCAYQIFIANTMVQLVPSIPRYAWVLIFDVCLASLIMFRTIHSLRYFALFADIAIVLVVIVLVILFGTHYHTVPSDIASGGAIDFSQPLFVWTTAALAAIGTCVYATEGIPVALPIEFEMQNKKQFPSAAATGFTIVGFLLLIVGLLGALAFAGYTQSMIFDNFHTSAIIIIAQTLTILHLLVTFAIELFPVTEMTEKCWFGRDAQEEIHDQHVIKYNHKNNSNVTSQIHGQQIVREEHRMHSIATGKHQFKGKGEKLLSKAMLSGDNQRRPLPHIPMSMVVKHRSDKMGGNTPYWQRVLWRVFLLICTSVVAMFVPKFAEFVSLVGSFGGVALTLPIPALLYWRATTQNSYIQKSKWKHIILPWFFIVFGSFLTIACTVSSIIQYIH